MYNFTKNASQPQKGTDRHTASKYPHVSLTSSKVFVLKNSRCRWESGGGLGGGGGTRSRRVSVTPFGWWSENKREIKVLFQKEYIYQKTKIFITNNKQKTTKTTTK